MYQIQKIAETINKLLGLTFPLNADGHPQAAGFIDAAASAWATDIFNSYEDIFLPPVTTRKSKQGFYKDFSENIDSAIKLIEGASPASLPEGIADILLTAKQDFKKYLDEKNNLITELRDQPESHKYIYSFADVVEGF